MTKKAKILVIDDDHEVSDAMQIVLDDNGYEVVTASTGSQGLRCLDRQRFELVITDFRLPDTTGTELLALIKCQWPDVEVVLITGYGSTDLAIEVIKKGAFYYLAKPFKPPQLIAMVEEALKWQKGIAGCAGLNENSTKKEFSGIIGANQRMMAIYKTIETAANSDASVLIEGESGTGKEMIATAFHQNGNRSNRPFIKINCAAIPRDLIESELFGYKKGAFTGADADKRGLLEAADNGILLLDEIAEMPAYLQTKLLRVLQERRLRPLGGEHEIRVNFRLICATNRDTLRAIADGTLREDLYYRISTIKIKVPPLRERLDDFELLSNYFLKRYNQKYGKKVRRISKAAVSLLERHNWPGNVRELENVIEHAVLFCQADMLLPENLPEQFQANTSGQFKCTLAPFMSMEEIEHEAISQTLNLTRGNVKKTAQILGIHRPTLYRKLKKFGIRNKAVIS